MLFSANTFVIIVVASLLAIGCSGWLRQARSDGRLERSGKRVQATVTSIEKRPGLAFTSYIITAAWSEPQTGTSYTFESEPDPRPPHERYVPGAAVDVLLDPTNPGRYCMEVDRAKTQQCSMR